MRIYDYEYKGKESDWEFSRVSFQKINLIVGDSGTGKTRLLNTIFNLGSFVAHGKVGGESEWTLSLGIDGKVYHWHVLNIEQDDEIIVEEEQLFLNDRLIVDRRPDKFIFDGGQPLPKLPKTEMSLYILKDEALVKPLHEGFSTMQQRKFFDSDLARSTSVYMTSKKALDKLGKKKDLVELYRQDIGLNPRLYVLHKYFQDIFKKIVSYYLEIFDFISGVTLLDSSAFDSINGPDGFPIFCIKERNVNKWIRLDELSSGMQKVLLILTDLFSLPKGGIYLIDEYENSLGIGGIDFLPDLLLSEDLDLQIFMTSHHPYIISHIPVKHWYVAHRNGSKVEFAYGEEVIKRYTHSYQDSYMQLINDPFYNEGVK